MLHQIAMYASPKIQTRPRSWLHLSGYVFYLGLVSGAIYFSLSNRFYDDPFITYRYALNLAEGMGFVYNPAQRVLSTTSPLHVFLLAGLSFLWADLPRLANLLGALSLAGGGLLLWDLAQTQGTPASGWASLALYPVFPLLVSTLGSETPLYLAFCLAAFASYARQRYRLAGLCAALASLTRPDGLVIFFLLAFHYLLRVRKPVPWQALLIFSIPLLAWVLFAWGYFGSPLPVTLSAKQYQGTMLISQRFAAGFLSLLDNYTRRAYFGLEVVFAAAGIYLSVTRRQGWLLIWAWMALHFIAYSLLGVSRYFWYYAPLVPGFIAATGIGIIGLTELTARQTRIFRGRLPLSGLLAAITILIIFAGQARELWAIRRAADSRYPVYRAAGEWLQANTPPTAKVGTLEVGIIGYYSMRPVIDFAGLLQPAVATHLVGRSSYNEAAVWAVKNFQPDSLVFWDTQFLDLQASYVADHCNLAKEIPADQQLFGNSLMIYTCYPAR